jgi:protein gp37
VADKTPIAWTDSTFNAWQGCQAVSAGCDNCYAEAMMHRFGGDFSERRRTSAENWKKPLRWNRAAEKAGVRRKVFSPSMGDPFDNQVPDALRADYFGVIRDTPWLDWQIVTKRPQNALSMLPSDWDDGWDNVWIGATAENQEELARRIVYLLTTPAKIHFLSVEPMLSRMSLRCIYLPTYGLTANALTGYFDFNQPCGLMEAAQRLAKLPGKLDRHKIDWVICGGESGHGARTAPEWQEWAEGLLEECRAERTPFFMKQMPKLAPIPEHLMVQQFPGHYPDRWAA